MLKHYLVSALRVLWKQRVYSAVNLIGLGIGLAISLIVFMYVRYEMSYDRQFPDSERIFRVALTLKDKTQEVELATTPTSLVTALRQDCPQVAAAARLVTNPVTSVHSRSDKIFHENHIFHIDPEFLEIFQFEFISGDAQSFLRQNKGVIITEEMAEKYFDQIDAVGQMLNFGHSLYMVTGVIKNNWQNSHLEFDFLLPMPGLGRLDWMNQGWDNADGQTGLVYTYKKMKDNCPVDAFAHLIEHISEHYPAGAIIRSKGMQQTYSLQPIPEIHLFSQRKNEIKVPGNPTDLLVLVVLSFLVVFIACFNHANFANMELSARFKELTIRKMLGASQTGLMCQYAVETLLLLIGASCCAILISGLVLPWFNHFLFIDVHFF